MAFFRVNVINAVNANPVRVKRRLRTRLTHFKILMDFMEQHSELVTGRLCTVPNQRERHTELWRELTDKLNAVDDETKKSVEKWQKVFTDWRYKTKQKVQVCKTDPDKRLSSLEQRLIKLVGIESEIENEPDADLLQTSTHLDFNSLISSPNESDSTLKTSCSKLKQDPDVTPINRLPVPVQKKRKRIKRNPINKINDLQTQQQMFIEIPQNGVSNASIPIPNTNLRLIPVATTNPVQIPVDSSLTNAQQCCNHNRISTEMSEVLKEIRNSMAEMSSALIRMAEAVAQNTETVQQVLSPNVQNTS